MCRCAKIQGAKRDCRQASFRRREATEWSHPFSLIKIFVEIGDEGFMKRLVRLAGLARLFGLCPVNECAKHLKVSIDVG